MKIALFYIRNPFASWYALGGYFNTLTAMGHQVLDCPLPQNKVDLRLAPQYPAPEALAECDCVLVTFAEYVHPWLKALYGDRWSRIMAKVPVIFRYDESFDRHDLGLPDRWMEMRDWAHHHSFPAAQDAERFGGQWEPFGVDDLVFRPPDKPTGGPTWWDPTPSIDPGRKYYEVAFIGSMYPLRQQYMQQLFEAAKAADLSFTFTLGQVFVQDLSGVRFEDSTRLLAENYRQIRIFFCLPPLSRLLVCKVFEVMGCGTFVMYPKLVGAPAANLSLFEDGKHIVYYEHGYPHENVQRIKFFLDHADLREKIARAGCDRVRERHTLRQMLGRILDLMGGNDRYVIDFGHGVRWSEPKPGATK